MRTVPNLLVDVLHLVDVIQYSNILALMKSAITVDHAALSSLVALVFLQQFLNLGLKGNHGRLSLPVFFACSAREGC